MSNFPPIEEIDKDIDTAGGDFQGDDFLSREKAVLGEDADAFGDEPDTQSFQSAFPEVQDVPVVSTSDITSGVFIESSTPYLPGQPDLVTETKKKLSLDDSQAIKEWTARRELEIQRRDEFSESKKAETRENAKKAIDDFYSNYNGKRDALVESTQSEAATFLEERDNQIGGGTTWDRIAKIVENTDKELKSGTKDKSRFKELIFSLKGDVNAPGAGGY